MDLSDVYCTRTKNKESYKGLKCKVDIMMLSIIVIIYATSTIYWLSILTISIMSVQALYHPELIILQEGEYIAGLYIVQIYLPMLNIWSVFIQVGTWLTIYFAVYSQ